jgi:hypothetical protein
MRHTTTARLATAAALLAVLPACGSSSDSDAKPAATASPHASPTDPVVPFMRAVEDAHLDSYADGIPAWQDLAQFPPKWCKALDDGHSVAWLFSSGGGGLYPSGMDWGTKKPDANQVLLFGVKAYCPKHLDTVTEELRATGEY